MKLNNFKYICPHLLNVVCEAGEAEAGDDEDEDQEAELPGALAQREDDGLQTPGVSGDRAEVIQKSIAREQVAWVITDLYFMN